jgi:TolB protein
MSARDGNSEIYVMDPAGLTPTRLTSNAATDDHPAWSPDGTRIAFSRLSSIFVMDANGQNPTQLFAGEEEEKPS